MKVLISHVCTATREKPVYSIAFYVNRSNLNVLKSSRKNSDFDKLPKNFANVSYLLRSLLLILHIIIIKREPRILKTSSAFQKKKINLIYFLGATTCSVQFVLGNYYKRVSIMENDENNVPLASDYFYLYYLMDGSKHHYNL